MARAPARIAAATTLTVNDREYDLVLDPRESLLDVLRDRLDLTGTRRAAGRIARTDVAQAERCAGVVAVLTPRRCPAWRASRYSISRMSG